MKLLFIDNDDKVRSEEDLDYVKDNLEDYAHIDGDIIDKITIVSDFWKLEKKEQKQIIFDPNAIICTWSMYTYTHFNSLGQFISLMRSIGLNGITKRIYLDCSGNLVKYLPGAIRNRSGEKSLVLPLIAAIQSNYIISFDSNAEEGKQCFRIKIGLSDGLHGNDFFEREYLNVNELIKNYGI